MVAELPTQSCRSDALRVQQYPSLQLLSCAILINAWEGWRLQLARREGEDGVLALYAR